MKALFKACIGVVTLLAAAGAAQASSVNLGTLTPTSGPLTYGLVKETGTFSDAYIFSVNSGPLPVQAGGVFFNWGGTFSALDLTFAQSTYNLLTAGSGNAVSIGTLASGTYDFSVSGTPTGQSASYGVQLTAVPVPAAVWLFGSGLVGLAAIGRWKKNSV